MSYAHHWRCDYALNSEDPAAECYCPMPGEELKRCGHLQEEDCWCSEVDSESEVPR